MSSRKVPVIALAGSLVAVGLLLAAILTGWFGRADRDDTALAVARADQAARTAGHLVDPGDLDHIKKRGTLRIVTFDSASENALPRAGLPASNDVDLAVDFGEGLGLRTEVHFAPDLDSVFRMVRDGKADIAAGAFTVTASRAKLVAFARPSRLVDEVLVGRRGDANNPRSMKDLAGRKIHVASDSSFVETVAAMAAHGAPGLTVGPIGARWDRIETIRAVGEGTIPLTLADADVLETVRTFDDSVESLGVVRRGSVIAWSVRHGNPLLKAAVDAFLESTEPKSGQHESLVGDLDEIRRRGVLRVVTRNDSVSYFLLKGRPTGFDYELAKMLAKSLGVRLEMVVPPRADDMLEWLESGRGDVIAAGLTVTPERRKRVAFSVPYLYTDEVLAGRPDSPPVQRLADLRGRPIHVHPTSVYVPTLRRVEQQVGRLDMRTTDKHLHSEDILRGISTGKFDYTVADAHIVQVEACWTGGVAPLIRLSTAPPGTVDARGEPRTEGIHIAFATRLSNPKLLAAVDAFVRETYRSTPYNLAKRRYFEDPRSVRKVRENRDELRRTGRLSAYDELIRKHAARRGFDWRLLAAQCHQESGFDPDAKSWVGACGLFQLMPATARELDCQDPTNPEENVRAGIDYMAQLVERFDELPADERIPFALASYNGGRGHVLDAMRLAKSHGYDPQRWYGHVEKAIALLEDRDIARTTRYGYCRASEVTGYVRAIHERYIAYSQILPK